MTQSAPTESENSSDVRLARTYNRAVDDMPPPLIQLHAIDEANNIRRRYTIEGGPDLLGDWLVETRWGRIGRGGQSRTEVFHTKDDASQCVRRHLRRRATSSLRIGAAYLDAASPPPSARAEPREIWTTRLRDYRWVDGFDGWVEDEDGAILGVHPARGTMPDRLLLAHARASPTTRAWGLYSNGEHLTGRELCISEFWANETIRARISAKAD